MNVVEERFVSAFGDRFKQFMIDHPNLVPAILAILKMFGLVVMDDGKVRSVPMEAVPSDIAVVAEAAKVSGAFLDFVKFLIANKELLAQVIAFIRALFETPTPAPIPPNPVNPNA
jgi:hypothetical protein